MTTSRQRSVVLYGDEPQASSSKEVYSLEKKYFATISGLAFTSGLVIATIGVRRHMKRLRQLDAKEAAERVAQRSLDPAARPTVRPSAASAAPSVAAPPVSTEPPMTAFQVFRDLNRGIFGGGPKVVRDASEGKEAPSILMRAKKATTVGDTSKALPTAAPGQVQAQSVGHSVISADSAAGDASDINEDVIREKPSPFLALQALAIATGITGLLAWAGVEVVRRVWQVNTIDEFMEKLTAGADTRNQKKAKRSSHESSIADDDIPPDTRPVAEPLPAEDVGQQLHDAVQRRDVKGWFEILDRQIIAESVRDRQKRQDRLAKARQEQQREQYI